MFEELKDNLQQLAGDSTSKNLSRAIEIAATISIAKSVSGFLHAVNIGMASFPTITIFDNASGASGTILFHHEPGVRGSYIVDVSFVSGLTAYLTAGNALAEPSLTANC